ncbi:protein HID1-like [Cheilinus undulatus]|uniref:protein HID1-like n=1 Tax=Cheilinus undulatus TaxID=241271 RepID=UPI001BD338D8|nr:protein HID1-like [Cheilinus undulatus]
MGGVKHRTLSTTQSARCSQGHLARVGLMHIGVFILLLLGGERNVGVCLNKLYTLRVPMDIPVFTGTHADLLIVVFHKIITSGHQRLQPLFDCLLTIIVNISPYLKSLSMVAANKLLHLLEAFSTPWFLFSSSQNHHLVFFLLEVFNNIIQYQFDGNFNLVYAIIRKRNVFHQLANLPSDTASIQKALQKKKQTSDRHEALTGSGPTGGEDLHQQGFDRRVRNLKVPPARHAGRPPACPSSHPHQEVPSQRRHRHVVQDIHVGRHLPTQCGSSNLVRHGHQAL